MDAFDRHVFGRATTLPFERIVRADPRRPYRVDSYRIWCARLHDKVYESLSPAVSLGRDRQ